MAMKFTNQQGLPEAIVRAIHNDKYSKGDADFSVTELLKPPRQRVLQKRFWDDITEDIQSRVWALLGQAMHSILERSQSEGVTERRLSIKVDGVTVSGAMDLFKDGVLIDYKCTSVWSIIYGRDVEWAEQLNLYAEILRANDIEVTKLEVLAILRDWNKRDLARVKNYPTAQVMVVPLDLWNPDMARSFLRQKIKAHRDAEALLPLCSYSERWGSAKSFGARCDGFCSVAKFCVQYQEKVER